MSVLFCDIVDSTVLANRLDPEDLLAVFTKFREIVRSVTRKHSGFRLRFIGDGARIVFGHPDTREDATESAVRCGLAVAEEMRAAKLLPDHVLELRVGIASGTAVLDEDLEETAVTNEAIVGTVVHLAARLAAAAAPGAVIIDHATRKLVGRFFECRDLGLMRLKGFDEEVRAWQAVGETGIASRHAAHSLPEGAEQMVGRETELALLSRAWEETRAGRGTAVILLGEPGVGKSRLAHALDGGVLADKGTRLEFDCTPRTCNTPLYPVSVLARRLAGIAASDDRETAQERGRALLTRLVAGAEVDSAMHYLGPLFTGGETLGGPPGESPELVRERTIGFILDLVHALGAEGPILIQFEDLHWSDPTTYLLLQRIVGMSSNLPILTIVTARPGSDIESLRLLHVTVLPLQSLDDEASRTLIAQISVGDPLPHDTREWIVKRAEGVPLFLEELTRTAVEALGRVGGARGMIAAQAEDIPATLQNVIQARLDRRPAQRAVVQAAAVLGREFSLPLLRELMGGKAAVVHNAIARLIDDSVLDPPDPESAERTERVRFKHALIQDAVYQTLLRSDRQTLHSKVSDILVNQMAGTPDASPDVLAYHLKSALRFEDAARCLVGACADNLAKAAYVEAIGHAQGGLALLENVPDDRTRNVLRRQLLIQLGVALSATNGYAAPQVEETYRQARELCDDRSEPAALYPIVRGLATYYLVRGELEAAHERAVQCMALAEQSGRADLRIDALCLYAYPALYFGRSAECRDTLERCLELYRTEHGERFTYPVPQDAATTAWALMPTAAWMLGDAEGAEGAIVSGLEHVERLGRPFDKAVLLAWIAGVRYTQRRYAECAEYARQCGEISQRYGYATWLATAAMMGLLAEAAQRPSPDALSRVQQLCAEFAQAGVGLNASYYLHAIARGLARMGAKAHAREAIAQAMHVAEASKETRMNAELMILGAELESDEHLALEQYRAALEVAQDQGAVPTALHAALAVVRLRGSTEDREAAQACLTVLEGQGAEPMPKGWLPDRWAWARERAERVFQSTASV